MKNSTKAFTARRPTKSRPRAERRPRQWWFEHYQAWKASGVSAAQYCAEQGIHLSSLYNWACRFQKESSQQGQTRTRAASPKPPSAFIEAVIQPPDSVRAQSLSVNDITVQFDSGISPESIALWVKALRAAPC